MTFKHSKFEDSVTMRSLEKVAREKGWVKSEPITKSASVTEQDLSPSVNLMENVFKLCAGLRKSGFNKQADELEVKFVQYKKANSLYETSKETGEDLVDAAHSEGSHKLEGVEGDSIFETIIDQHLAHLKMIEKHPTGKLANSKDILKAVKIVLGQLEPVMPIIPDLVVPAAGAAVSGTGAGATATGGGLAAAAPFAVILAGAIAGAVVGNMAFETYFNPSSLQEAGNRLSKEMADLSGENGDERIAEIKGKFDTKLRGVIDGMMQASTLKDNPTLDNFKGLKNTYNNLLTLTQLASEAVSYSRDKYSVNIFSGYADIEKSGANFINTAQKSISRVISFLNEVQSKISAATPKPAVVNNDGLSQRLNTLKEKLQGYRVLDNIETNRAATDWITKQMSELDGLLDRLSRIPASQLESLTPVMSQKIKVKEDEIAQFYNDWVKTS